MEFVIGLGRTLLTVAVISVGVAGGVVLAQKFIRN